MMDYRLKELIPLRQALAEYGIEVTLEKVSEVFSMGSIEQRDCSGCNSSDLGLCFSCFLDRLKESGHESDLL